LGSPRETSPGPLFDVAFKKDRIRKIILGGKSSDAITPQRKCKGRWGLTEDVYSVMKVVDKAQPVDMA